MLRTAQARDRAQILPIYEAAKAFLKAQGLDQWQYGYPNAASLEADVQAGVAYVFGDECVLGTVALVQGDEPVYAQVEGGEWQTPETYLTIHRIAVAPETRGQGIGRKMIEAIVMLAQKQGIPAIRTDTHAGNLPMQAMLTTCGFCKVGIVTQLDDVEKGAKRTAFELKVES